MPPKKRPPTKAGSKKEDTLDIKLPPKQKIRKPVEAFEPAFKPPPKIVEVKPAPPPPPVVEEVKVVEEPPLPPPSFKVVKLRTYKELLEELVEKHGKPETLLNVGASAEVEYWKSLGANINNVVAKQLIPGAARIGGIQAEVVQCVYALGGIDKEKGTQLIEAAKNIAQKFAVFSGWSEEDFKAMGLEVFNDGPAGMVIAYFVCEDVWL